MQLRISSRLQFDSYELRDTVCIFYTIGFMIEILFFFLKIKSVSASVRHALDNRPVFIRLKGLVRCNILGCYVTTILFFFDKILQYL